MNILNPWVNPAWLILIFLIACMASAVIVLAHLLRDTRKQIEELAQLNVDLTYENQKIHAHKKLLKRLVKENIAIFLVYPEAHIRNFARKVQKEQCQCAYCQGHKFIKDIYDEIALKDD